MRIESEFVRRVFICSILAVTLATGFERLSASEFVDRSSRLESQPLVPEGNWSEANSEMKWRLVGFLADQMQSNFHQIRTWTGTYRVRSIEPQREGFLRSAFLDRIEGRDISDVTLEREFKLDFVIDVPGQKVYRVKNSDLMYWRNRKTDEQFNFRDTTPADERSFSSGEEYVHFDPVATWPEFNHLLDNPDAMMKRAAFRESVEVAKRKHYGDMLDPLVFFGHDQDSRLWETLTVCLDAHQGKAGTAQKAKAEEAVQCFESNVGSRKFIRFDFNVQPTSSSKNEPILHSSWIFDSEHGFNPVSFFMWRGDEQHYIRQMKWTWKSVDGVFVPEIILDIFDETTPNGMKLWRECELQESRVNVPLKPDQFTIQGLGLTNGELVVDHLTRSVSMLRGGALIHVGKFGDQYVPPKVATPSDRRYLLLTINLVAAGMLLAFLAFRRRRRITGGTQTH